MIHKNKSSNGSFTDNVLIVESTDTLNSVIDRLGMHTESAGAYLQKHVKSGNHILFTGKSSEVWELLVKMGYIERAITCPDCPDHQDEQASLSIQ